MEANTLMLYNHVITKCAVGLTKDKNNAWLNHKQELAKIPTELSEMKNNKSTGDDVVVTDLSDLVVW